MKFTSLILLVLCATVLCSCKTQKESSEMNDEQKENVQTNNYFIIGSGGGFTGMYNEFKVYSTGQVDKLNEEIGEFESYTKISDVNIGTYFLALTKMDLISIDFDHPGNMTFYIKVKTDDGMHIVKWGDAKFEIKKEVELFFESVMTEIYSKER